MYCCKFTKPLVVKKVDDRYYLYILLHDNFDGGLVISNQCDTDDEFLKFVEKELRSKRLDRSRHFKLNVYANIETQERI